MKRKFLSGFIAVVFVFVRVPSVTAAVTAGQVIQFGGYDWRVLDVQDGRALLLSDKVLEERPYNDTKTNITWAESDIRAYLNGAFFNSFNEADKARIAQTTVINDDNPWFGTPPGGEDTDDYIFLLSLDELVLYFGDADELAKPEDEREEWWGFDGVHADKRMVRCIVNSCWCNSETYGHWWWLRSPGIFSYDAAYVNGYGIVIVLGNSVHDDDGGVRPALWLDMKQPADTGAGGAGAAAALFLVCAAVCIKSRKRRKM
ncbi:MAG: DUF6273 domain-containing protein [Oscillospiraceae bacterium]|nr:DUF6273 domain-containing protein [Oscillospiraceae bacterium]